MFVTGFQKFPRVQWYETNQINYQNQLCGPLQKTKTILASSGTEAGTFHVFKTALLSAIDSTIGYRLLSTLDTIAAWKKMESEHNRLDELYNIPCVNLEFIRRYAIFCKLLYSVMPSHSTEHTQE